MSFKHFGDWLLTKTAKQCSLGLAVAVSIGAFSFKFFPNTYFLNEYRDVVHLYKHGLSVPLPQELRDRFEKAINMVNIEETHRKLFKPFCVYGFDTFHAGTTYSKFGAIIGIPINFTYTDTDTIDKQMIKLKGGESVPWGTEEATELLDSYVMSENAQLYAIAREIKAASSSKLILDTFFITFAMISCYGINNFFNNRLNLYTRPRPMRITLYILTTIFVFGNYFFAKDYAQVHYEHSIDRFLKETSPSFAEGGKEYYEKMLKRNKALRKLLGGEGESMFSTLGNENFFLRQKHIPLVHRKEFFESNLPN